MLYRELNQQQDALADQEMDHYRLRGIIRERNAEIDAELEELSAQRWRAERERDAEWRKLERYCQEQRTVLRQLEDLTARAQQMYELNNEKDQVMTVCKVALANLGMWTRDHYFPGDYASRGLRPRHLGAARAILPIARMGNLEAGVGPGGAAPFQ